MKFLSSLFLFFSLSFPLHAQDNAAQFALLPSEPALGDPLTVAWDAAQPLSANELAQSQAVLLDTQGRRIVKAKFFDYIQDNKGGEVMAAILGIPCTALAGPMSIHIETGDTTVKIINFRTADKAFKSEVIPLDTANSDIRTKPDAEKTKQSEELWTILDTSTGGIYDGGPFVPPVTSHRRTSLFGTRRIYVYADKTTGKAIHAGIDYGVPTGTPVRACGAGKVVLAKFRISTGNSVIIEHLPGLYSIYYHMKSLKVHAGSMVKTGGLLGYSGSTGLATGPHLHWELRASTVNCNPDAFIAKAVLDKKTVFAALEAAEEAE
jgi:murein DD-endopeptidase MepM/ murein hydrolase activator NlpD